MTFPALHLSFPSSLPNDLKSVTPNDQFLDPNIHFLQTTSTLLLISFEGVVLEACFIQPACLRQVLPLHSVKALDACNSSINKLDALAFLISKGYRNQLKCKHGSNSYRKMGLTSASHGVLTLKYLNQRKSQGRYLCTSLICKSASLPPSRNDICGEP